MPAAPLPPMTTRQAKKLSKKKNAQFEYTASQMRRADRREELEKRKKQEEWKENQKVVNKKKREEQEEKERAVKRKLFQEGKIALEDTWGKVTASQPRLNNFFKQPSRPVNKERLARVPAQCDNTSDAPIEGAENKENEYVLEASQEETLVNQAPIIIPPAILGDEISDIDLLKLISSQARLSQHTPPDSAKRTPQTRSRTRNTVSTVRITSPSILMRERTLSPSSTDFANNDFPDKMPDPEVRVAEDHTAEAQSTTVAPHQGALAESFSSPPRSFRSVLSEMSVANVNTRAHEKPDTTSVQLNSGLVTPSKPRDAFASFNSADFDDDEQLTWDKENSDPLQTPDKPKAKSKSSTENCETATAGPSTSTKKAPPPGFSEDDNFEDIYDFDFETGDNDFEDEVDDATLMTLSTQEPKGDKIVDLYGSPRKLTHNKDVLVKSAPLQFTPGKLMPPPPSKSKIATSPKPRTEKNSAEKRNESPSFASVGDDDLLEIAEQVEEELSQRSQKGKAVAQPTSKVPALKKKRTFPWDKNPMPPPSTQDFLVMLADQIDAELDG